MTTKILIIRFKQLGDSILSSSLCTSIKQSAFKSEIHYVLNEHIAPVFEDHPDIDKIITFSEKENKDIKLYIKKIWNLMRSEKYDIIIDTRSTVRTLFFSLFSLQTRFRIGRKKTYSKYIHNYRIENLPDLVHDTVQLTLKLVEPLEKKYSVNKNEKFYLKPNSIEKNRFRKKMEAKGINFSRPIIFCNVVTKIPSKCWDINKMQIIIQKIIDNYKNLQLIFNYGNDIEKNIAYEILEKCNNTDRIFMNIEAKNTRELALMISNCNFFFGNEGGSRHIAQALDIPSYAIYSPAARKITWLPSPSENNQGIEAEDITDNKDELSSENKFDLIDVDSVWNTLNKILENNKYN